MTVQRTDTTSAGRGRRARVIGLSGALLGLLALLLAVSVATGDGQSILSSLQSSSSATAAPSPNPASRAALYRSCIAKIHGDDALVYFRREIPESRWGEPLRGTASTTSEPYVLWIFDAQCEPHRAIEVGRASSRTFKAEVGQVWYYAEASAGPPADDCSCRVFSPSTSGTEQEFSDEGGVIYHLD
ncbi:hypothetical protein AB0B48_06890 [Micromonospora sp. NPDC049089]|uniref:hypothetical protein n=1 Tax=Micromonospora sp. NPDC049089 TaxID=3155496 RepID=UPI0033F750BE